MELKYISIKIKLIIFAYSIWSMFTLESVDKFLIIYMLLYIITIFLNNLVSLKYEVVTTIAEATIAFLIAVKYVPIAIVLFSIAIMEYLLHKTDNIIFIVLVSIIPLIFVGNNLLNGEVVVLVAILLLFFITYYKNQVALLKFEEESENNRREIYKLQDKLKEEQDFKEQFLYTMQLEERNKISGKLHDKIGHTISGTLLQLEAIRLTIDNNKEQGKKLLEMSIKNLRVGMDDIRMTLRDVRPQQEELGINRIKLILDEKTNNTKYNYKIHHQGELEKVSTTNWVLFVQAIKELSTNSIKYSKGSNIEINIWVLNKLIKFEVKDDGIGNSNVKKGIGLSSLEEKVAGVDGKLIINGEDGFSVIILIPFN